MGEGEEPTSSATGRWIYCQARRCNDRCVWCPLLQRGLQDTQTKKGTVGGEAERDVFLSPHSTATSPSAILPTRLHHHSRPLGFVILEGAARSNRKSVFRRTYQREPREAYPLALQNTISSLSSSTRRRGGANAASISVLITFRSQVLWPN